MYLEKGLHEYGAHAPRPPGGGGRIGPNPVFLNNVRSVTGINAKLGVPLATLILRPFTKFWTIFSKSFSYTDLSEPISCIFLPKTDKRLENHQKYRFKVKWKYKHQKRRIKCSDIPRSDFSSHKINKMIFI